MTQNHVPFRYDYVGSFLRPEKLKVAREKFQNNEITQEELKKVEDYYILDLIEKQKKLVTIQLQMVSSVVVGGI